MVVHLTADEILPTPSVDEPQTRDTSCVGIDHPIGRMPPGRTWSMLAASRGGGTR